MHSIKSFNISTFVYNRCKYHSGSVSSGGTITLNCDGSNHGRYVYVMLRGKDFLTLCEVEVYSKKGMINILLSTEKLVC